MGAWGCGLFQSDSDLDKVDELNDQVGVIALEEAARAKAKSEREGSKNTSSRETESEAGIESSGHSDSKGDDSNEESEEDNFHYTICAQYCSDVATVRDYMIEDDRFIKLVQKYEAKILEDIEDPDDYSPHQYYLILLIACGMTLGCSVPDKYLALLETAMESVNLESDAYDQLRKALDEYPNDGTPYRFDSKGLMETMMEAAEEDEAAEAEA